MVYPKRRDGGTLSGDSPLLTDLYQISMLEAYFAESRNEEAIFEFHARRLPENRGFLVAAGLEQALDYLENLSFSADDIDILSRLRTFGDDFLDSLRDFRFLGEVHAMPEGTVFFPEEPILRVTAPLPAAQFVESRLINILHYQTVVASKAARIVLAAKGRGLVDFGFRRAHGAEAGVMAARASYLAGFDGTATVLAGANFDIPLSGTMAHSYVLVHDSEAEAFLTFARTHRGSLVFLIDTHDTVAGARTVVSLSEMLREEGIEIHGVRIDSGDLNELSRSVRAILDAGGLTTTRILVSGDLDEASVRDLVESGAPIDGFGVGTRMTTSADAPYLNSAYKLQALDGAPKRKESTGKVTLPCAKQVYRRTENGRMAGDFITLDVESERRSGEEALLLPVWKEDRRIHAETLAEARKRMKDQLSRLPEPLRRLEKDASYPVTVSKSIQDMIDAMKRKETVRCGVP